MSPPVSVIFSALYLCLMVQESAADTQKNIRAKPGQNVTLPCEVTVNNNNNIVVVWIRPDLETHGYVLLYADGELKSSSQLESFTGRVSLPDKWMETGDVSLILENVTNEDSGTYECRVKLEGSNRRKRAAADTINTVRLSVTAGQKEGGGDKEGGDEEEVSRSHVVGIVIGLVLVAVVGVVVGVLRNKHQKKKNSPPPDEEPVKHELMNLVTV